MQGSGAFRVYAAAAVLVFAVVAVLWLSGAVGRRLSDGPGGSVDVAGLDNGDVRAVYLDEGWPAFVIRHDDGAVTLVSAFDAHQPGVRQLLWWCPTSASFEGPATGSRYDEYGVKYAGPAPSGLVTWTLDASGGSAGIGSEHPAPLIGTPFVGPPPQARPGCFGEDGVVYHAFDGWRVWTSPSALADAAPRGWVRVDGELRERDGVAELCAVDDCSDVAPARGITVPAAALVGLLPFGDRQWLARVDLGQLFDLTRIVDPDEWTRDAYR